MLDYMRLYHLFIRNSRQCNQSVDDTQIGFDLCSSPTPLRNTSCNCRKRPKYDIFVFLFQIDWVAMVLRILNLEGHPN